MRNKKPEKPTSATPLELPAGKFEIRLPATEENKTFADKCSAAYLSGATILYKEINHHVYHWGFDMSKMTVDTKPDYVIGLVRAE